jgi:hypothetical protein
LRRSTRIRRSSLATRTEQQATDCQGRPGLHGYCISNPGVEMSPMVHRPLGPQLNARCQIQSAGDDFSLEPLIKQHNTAAAVFLWLTETASPSPLPSPRLY